MAEVEVRNNNIEDALRRLRQRVGIEGILLDLKIKRLCHTAKDRVKIKQRAARKRRMRIERAIARREGRRA